MSRGLGHLQRRLSAALAGEPGRRFTVEELAEIAYPGQAIERWHLVSVRRALKNLPDNDLRLSRYGKTGVRGWRYHVRSGG